MFRNNKAFFGLLLGIVLLGFVIGKLDLGRDTSTATLLPQAELGAPTPQASQERRFEDKPTEVLRTFGEEPLLAGPLQLKADGQGHVFVADFNQSQVFQYSESGEPLRTFGNGLGQGPGEFQTLTDFTVHAEHLWITDPTNGAISLFSMDGALVKTFKTPQPIYRLAKAGGRTYGMFSVADHRFVDLGSTQHSVELGSAFGEMVREQLENSILLDGWLEPGPGGSLVYVPRHLSFFIVYGADGQVRSWVQTINPHPTPKVVQDGQSRWVDRAAPKSALSTSTSGDELHILTIEDWDAIKKRGVIDTYSLVDGRYLHSIRVPEACESAIVTEKYVYTVLEDTIRQWARVTT